jgi:hypothetical protein
MFQVSKIIKNYIEIITVFASIVLAYIFNEAANNISAIILVTCGIGLYIHCCHKEKNLFSFSGLICAGFLCPMGLALFRLSAFQIPWLPATWLCFLLAPICFLIGLKCAPSFLNWADLRLHGQVLTERAERRPRLLFCFGICVFAVAMATMLIKWHAAGFLPLFADSTHSYIEFLFSEGHSAPAGISSMYLLPWLYNLFLANGWPLMLIWLVPSIMVIYYIKADRPMKIVCGAICLFAVLVTMVVLSRELYMMTMVSLTVTTYFCLSRKKLISVLVLLAITCVGFNVMSNARNYSNDNLKAIFEIGKSSTSRQGRAQAYTRKARPDIAKNFPSIVVWAYTYFTCGFDNFDHLVEVSDRFYYGLSQLRPAIVVLRMKGTHDISGSVSQNPDYRISVITIYSFLKEPYLDFGIPGVAFSLFFWGLVFGTVEMFFLRFRGKLSLLCYAAFAHHLVFVSFVNWMLHTSYLFSLVLLCALFFFIYDFRKGKNGE